MTGVEVAMIGLAAAGAVTGAMGAIAAGNSAKAQADAQAKAAAYQQQVQMRNQQIADQNRILALQQGEIDAEDQRRENRRMLSAIRTAYGASGLAMAGSPLDVLEDSAAEGELDAQRKQFEGRVRGRESALQMLEAGDQAVLAGLEASSARSRAKMATTVGYLNAGSSLLSGAGNAMFMYNKSSAGSSGTQKSG